jgi:hypothetical protein
MFNVSNEGDVDPLHANKTFVIIKLQLIIIFVDAYVGTK